ncbi:hypothetical protein [Pandoraea norimbergensis]
MPTTWIEVADNAVKIGLGAVVAAWASIHVATLKHKGDRRKDSLDNKRRLLEGAIVETEPFFRLHRTFLNKAQNGSRRADEAKSSGNPFTAEQIAKVRAPMFEMAALDGPYLSRYHDALRQAGFLKLTGSSDEARMLKDLLALCMAHRNCITGPQMPQELQPESEISGMTDQFIAQRNAYEDAIGRHYSAL